LQFDSNFVVRFFRNRDQKEVINLVTSTFNKLNKDFWMWKYKQNPKFEKPFILITENKGKVIGCMHYMPRELKIASFLNIKSALGADFVVQPSYRKQGIGSRMLKFSRDSKVLEKKGILATIGFVDRKKTDFYKSNIGSIIKPVYTVRYSKFLGASPIQRKIESLEKTAVLEGLNMTIIFRLSGFPTFTLKIAKGIIKIESEEVTQSDVTVEGDPFLFESLYDGSNGIIDLAIGILKRKIKVRGNFWKILSLYRVIRRSRK